MDISARWGLSARVHVYVTGLVHCSMYTQYCLIWIQIIKFHIKVNSVLSAHLERNHGNFFFQHSHSQGHFEFICEFLQNSHKEQLDWRPMEWPICGNEHLFPQWNHLQHQHQHFQHQMHLHNQNFFNAQKQCQFGEDLATALLTTYNDNQSGASSPPGAFMSSSNSTTSTSSGVSSCLSPNSQPNFTPNFNFFGKTAPPFEAAEKHQPLKQVKEEPVFDVPRKKSKKGPAPKLFGNERCKICDSRATGFHYNVLSCEACKVKT